MSNIFYRISATLFVLSAVLPFQQAANAQPQYNNVADMLSTVGTNYSTIRRANTLRTLGLATPGDNGEVIDWRWDSTNTLPTNMLRLQLGGLATGRLVREWNGDVRAFGAVSSTSIDNTAAINAAASNLWASGGGVLKFPPGIWRVTGTLRVYPNVVFEGAMRGWDSPYRYNTNSTAAQLAEAGASVIYLANGANVPMVTNVPSTYVRHTTSTLSTDGRGGAINQYLQNSGLRNLVLDGNAGGQTVWDADCVRISDCFTFFMDGVSFFRPSGYYVRAWNCNVVHIDDWFAVADATNSKGFLFFDTADSYIGAGLMTGSMGPNLWLASNQTVNNRFVGGHYGDPTQWPIGGKLLSVASNWITVEQDPKLQTGDPFQFWTPWSGGTMPSSVYLGKTYFAVRSNATTFGFNDSLPDAIAGTVDTMSDIGTGVWMVPGPQCNVYISDGAFNNNFVGCVLDAAIDGNLVLNGGRFNSFIGGQLSRAGLLNSGDYTNASAIWVRANTFGTTQSNDFSHNKIWATTNGIRIDASTATLYGNNFFVVGTNHNFAVMQKLPLEKDSDGVFRFDRQIGLQVDSSPGLSITSSVANPIRVSRTSGAVAAYTFGPGAWNDGFVGGDAWNQSDAEIGGLVDLSIGGNSTNAILTPGSVVATPRTWRLMGQRGSGTDAAGGDVRIEGGYGSGTGTPGAIRLMSAVAYSGSGTTGQTNIEALKVVGGTTSSNTAIYVNFNGSIRRVGVTNSGGIAYLFLEP